MRTRHTSFNGSLMSGGGDVDGGGQKACSSRRRYIMQIVRHTDAADKQLTPPPQPLPPQVYRPSWTIVFSGAVVV